MTGVLPHHRPQRADHLEMTGNIAALRRGSANIPTAMPGLTDQCPQKSNAIIGSNRAVVQTNQGLDKIAVKSESHPPSVSGPVEANGRDSVPSGSGVGLVSNGIPTKVKKPLNERFKNYLSLLFSDLCAKDNGLCVQRVHHYTFLKVSISLAQGLGIH